MQQLQLFHDRRTLNTSQAELRTNGRGLNRCSTVAIP